MATEAQLARRGLVGTFPAVGGVCPGVALADPGRYADDPGPDGEPEHVRYRLKQRTGVGNRESIDRGRATDVQPAT
jgi:hypothetical protein